MNDRVRQPIGRVRRAFVLIAVLVIVGSALLVATSLLFFAQTEAAMSTAAAEAAQSRAIIWSGLQAIMSRIDDQRQKILNGDRLEIEPQLIIYETATRAGIVRMLHAHDGSLLTPEAGKLDLNAASVERFVATGLIDQSIAERVVQHRLRRPFQSVYDLLALDGADITAEQLYGQIHTIDWMDEAQRPVEDVGERIASRLESPQGRGWNDIFTVFSVEPALQRDGSARINLNQPWSDALGSEIEAQFGREAAERIKSMLAEGKRFENDASIVKTLRELNVPPEEWPPIVDAFTTEPGRFHYGRLDINTAPYEALLGLPGITSEMAGQIVRVREELPPDQRATIAWLVTEQIVAPEDFESLAGKITTRCWTYRVRLAAGEVLADELDGALMNPIIVEAVIDASDNRPRIAYWRDITLLQAAVRLSLDGAAADADGDAPSEAAAATSNPEPGPIATNPPAIGSEVPEAPESQPRMRRVGRWIVSE